IGVGSMAWLNILGILLLQVPALKALKDYRQQKKQGLDPQFDPRPLGIKNAEIWALRRAGRGLQGKAGQERGGAGGATSGRGPTAVTPAPRRPDAPTPRRPDAPPPRRPDAVWPLATGAVHRSPAATVRDRKGPDQCLAGGRAGQGALARRGPAWALPPRPRTRQRARTCGRPPSAPRRSPPPRAARRP